MARIKRKLAKKTKHTIMPTEDQPYTIPDNWYWITLNACKAGEDGFFDGDWILSENMDQNGEVRLLQLSDIGIGVFLDKSDKHISKKTFEQLNCTQLIKGDVMISRMAEPIARSCIVPSFPYTVITAVDVAVLRCDNRIIDNRYVNYLCNTKWFTELAYNLARGTTRVRITRTNLGEMPVPLPPLPEQQRIVDRIESLFAKLDEAKEKAQAVVDGFEDRKAAILHKAFTGELTAEWRKKKAKKQFSLEKRPFESCIDVMQNGLSKRKGDNGKPYVVIRLANLGEDGFDITDLREILLDEKEQKTYELKPNDVLMIRVNGSKDNVGKQFIVGDQRDWAFCDHIIRLRFAEDIHPEYMVNFSKTREYKTYVMDNMVSSAGQNTISRKGMAGLCIPIPSKDEQQEIIKALNRLLIQEVQVKENAEQVISQIDTMKKAILARAFRGELGTNDPSEPPADIGIS